MVTKLSANKLELLQIANAVAQEKSIEPELVLDAICQAITKSARQLYGTSCDIRTSIDPKTGETNLQKFLEIVDEVEDDSTQIHLKDAQKIEPKKTIGEFITQDLPPIEFGRIATQQGKQVIFQNLREAERERQYEEFKDRAGEVITGIVKRVEYGNAIVDLGRGEAILRRDQLIPKEVLKPNDRVCAYIKSVRREQRAPQIILSRTDPYFIAKLFAQEVPELYEGIIEIRAVARDPGSRAKIAVMSNDSSVDPVGACVGMRGVRVQAVVNELQGEKVDIIPWSLDPATFVVNALTPAELAKVVLDEDAKRVEVVVPQDQLSLAIGRRGQNVRLASQLTDWDIDILTEAEESERRQKEFTERSQMFMEQLDVDETIAQLLASDGFSTLEEIAFVSLDEITHIEGFDDDTAQELQTRAKDYLALQNKKHIAEYQALGVKEDLASLKGLSPLHLVALGQNNIKTLEDFAGLVPDDLTGSYKIVEVKDRKNMDKKYVREIGIFDGQDITRDTSEDMIMQARLKMGWIGEDDIKALQEKRQDIADQKAQNAAQQSTNLAAPSSPHKKTPNPQETEANIQADI